MKSKTTINSLTGKTVWIVRVWSDSGDHYAPWVFSKKPSQDTLKSKVMELNEDYGDGENGPGIFGSYIFLSDPAETTIE